MGKRIDSSDVVGISIMVLVLMLRPDVAPAQVNGSATSHAVTTEAPTQPTIPKPPPASGVLVDQVLAVVNGDLVLESDVEEERRFTAFQPYRDPAGFSRDRAIERMIDRTLILQQAKLQPENAVTLDEARAQLATIRKDIPACARYHCETQAGWEKFVHDQGFTLEELTDRWRQRMEILKYIEIRFRSGVQVSPAEIKAYYDKALLPEYARQKATAPKLAAISDRIQEILLQQQVSSLLGDWLKSLKAQGSVRVIRPGEVQP